ncbi:MAG: toxin-antitoxin system HicB family antitoxin [Sphingomonadaceae bacterium]
MSSEKKAFALRLDPAVYDAVERLAAAELRSVNAEMEILLRDSLAGRGIEVARTSIQRRRGRPKSGATRAD